MTDTTGSRSLFSDVCRIVELRENDPRDRGAMYGALPLLVEVVEAARDVAAQFHDGGRFISNGKQAVPLYKLERLREKLEALGV